MSHCINNNKNSLHYAYEINTSMSVQLVSFPIFVILYRPRLKFLKSFLKELLVDDYRDFKFKHDKSVGLNKSTQLNFILHLELHLIRSQTALIKRFAFVIVLSLDDKKSTIDFVCSEYENEEDDTKTNPVQEMVEHIPPETNAYMQCPIYLGGQGAGPLASFLDSGGSA